MDERDGASMGRAAGALLADTLLAIADGKRPRGPVGISRVGRESRRVEFATHAEAGTWLNTPGLAEPLLLDVADNREVRVLVPAVSNTTAAVTSFDIIWRVRFAIDDAGVVLTSEPGFHTSDLDGVDELLDDFNDGIAAGLERHPRTAELREGFGALGPSEAHN